MDKAFSNQEIVDATEIDPLDMKCPRCKADLLVLHGQSQLSTVEFMKAGEIYDQISKSAEFGSFNVERIDCLTCERSFIIQDPKVFRLERKVMTLEQENHTLRTQLDQKGGNSSTPAGSTGFLH